LGKGGMKKQIEMLWGYNYWANRRILARAETLIVRIHAITTLRLARPSAH
jgi:hypothetical protein